MKEKKIKSNTFGDYQPFVSVVIPARNEEKNIINCLNSFKLSIYPKDKFEILLINDRSTDSTQSVAESILSEYSNLRIINITEANRNINLKGKPGALDFGFREAKGEIILMTDADCVVNPEWISTIVSSYSDPEVKIGAAFTSTDNLSIFHKFQSLEWITMCTMGSAGVALNMPIGCYGNNMSIKKETYLEIGGYENIDFSVTEDLSLLKAVINKGHKARYQCNFESSIKTNPCITIKEYLVQHHRWAKGGLALGWFAVVFVLSSSVIWLSLLASIFYSNIYTFIGTIIFKILADYWLIIYPIKKIKETKLLKWLIPGSLFLLLLELVVPFLLLKKKIVWKDQVFK
jgi:cellulose synthase/poly-beta-1,6-N-acetylglucosamine synthase-like glycosyltransferase